MSATRSEHRTLVVLSGGQDSTMCLFWAKQHFREVHAITFDYAQRHSVEIKSAEAVARIARVASHSFIRIGPVLQGASPLVSTNEVPQYESVEQMPTDGVEPTFVPNRNHLFLTIAANRAYALRALSLVTGVSQEDYGGYPDCRKPFIDAQTMAIRLANAVDQSDPWNHFVIHTPLINLEKVDEVRFSLGIPNCYFAWAFTHTAYDGKYPPTGRDHATLLRVKGFEKAGLPDPLVMRAVFDGEMELPATSNYDIVREKKPEDLYELCDVVGAQIDMEELEEAQDVGS